MDKFLIPGAIVVAALVGAFRFRHEVLWAGQDYVMVVDRWAGTVDRCHIPWDGRKTFCRPSLSEGYDPIQ